MTNIHKKNINAAENLQDYNYTCTVKQRIHMKPIIAISSLILLFSCSTKELSYTSSDKNLEKTFEWARETALSYAHYGEDPVGLWYEAALPSRYAFCMRDASHQSIGAEILGLSGHNYNMMQKFAAKISESKDWCTYWEIDKWDKPCEADYEDDKDFWYNLNANFDVTDACWRLYEWTGDRRYLEDEVFMNFYDISCKEYVQSWKLAPEDMLTRDREVNRLNGKRFGLCRGIPSYVESVGHMNNSADLIGTIYGGFSAYAHILAETGRTEEAASYEAKAEEYRSHLDSCWWDENAGTYHTFLWSDGSFGDGEGLTHVLWFNIVNDPERISKTAAKMMERKEWNIENISYFPALWYRYAYKDEAYAILSSITEAERKEYPEVSFGMIEGIICGMMGISPSASRLSISTLPQISGEHWMEVSALPMLGGLIDVRHDSNSSTTLRNRCRQSIIWQACFYGEFENIEINGRKHPALHSNDAMGNPISYIEVKVRPGRKISCSIQHDGLI